MSEQHKKTARRLFEELWNHRKLSVADEILTPDARNIDPNTPDFGAGPESYRKVVNMYCKGLPDLRLVIEDMVAEGDKVVVRWSCSGTHQGELHGIEPTGRKVTTTGITICQFSNDKIANQWVIWDGLGFMQQLGVVPKDLKYAA